MGKDPLSDDDKALNAANSVTLSHCKAFIVECMDGLESELMEVELDVSEVLRRTIYLSTFSHIISKLLQSAAENVVASMDPDDYEECIKKMPDWINDVEVEFARITRESFMAAKSHLDPKERSN